MPTTLQAALGDSDRTERALLASLPPRVRSSLKDRLSPEYDLLGFDLMKPLDPCDADLVLTWLDYLDTPPPRPILVQEITRCLMLTKSRAQDQNDQTLMLAALTQELSDFPADVVTTELRRWSRREKWWPALSELRDACQRSMRVRKSLRNWCERDALGLMKLPA